MSAAIGWALIGLAVVAIVWAVGTAEDRAGRGIAEPEGRMGELEAREKEGRGT